MCSKKIDLSDPQMVKDAMKENGGEPVRMNVYLLYGVYGELPGCEGLAEDLINTDEKLKQYGLDPVEGGTFIKLIGCSYLYKGDPATEKVKGIEQAKSNISVLPRRIIGASIVLSSALAFLYAFFRKRFWWYVFIFADEIRMKTVRIHDIPEARYNKCEKEIKRAIDVAIRKVFKIAPDENLVEDLDIERIKRNPMPYAIARFVKFFTLFINLDAAYRFPTQDMLGELKKENAKRSGLKEAMRLLDIMVERTTTDLSVKFRHVKRMLWMAMLINPKMRKLIREFLLELNIEKVGLDEADYYFCLRRTSYNYKGKTLDQRLRELYLIDKEKEHQYVNIEFRPTIPNAPGHAMEG